MNFRLYVPNRSRLAIVLLAAITLLPLQAAGDDDVPASVAALLPAGAEPTTQSWAVYEDEEFGDSFGGSMDAKFPGKYPSCSWSLYKSRISIELKGQMLDKTPWMLDQAVEIYESDYEASGQSMAEDLARSYKNNDTLKSIGAVQEEQFLSGRIAYIEWTEDCDRHPNGTKTKLTGSARREANILTFDLELSATGAEARAMALEILSKFEQLDFNALYK
jgi:hypothetical protein